MSSRFWDRVLSAGLFFLMLAGVLFILGAWGLEDVMKLLAAVGGALVAIGGVCGWYVARPELPDIFEE